MKVFIIHYTKLQERMTHIRKQLAPYGFDVEFVTDHDGDKLTKDDLVFFEPDILTNSEMSIIRKHVACYESVCRDDHEYALILEDDVILSADFETKLNNYVSQLPPRWDLCFIGNGCDLHVPDSIISKHPPGTNIFRRSNYNKEWGGEGASRCADSYLVSRKCAYKILEYLDKPDYRISVEQDHLLNEISRYKLLTSYWAEPTIVEQGSMNGTFPSSLDSDRYRVRQRLMSDSYKKSVVDDMNRQRNEKKLAATRETQAAASRRRQAAQAKRTGSETAGGLSDRPLAGIRPVAGRPANRMGLRGTGGGGGGKGRFSKFNF